MKLTSAERFWAKVQKSENCWEWIGCRQKRTDGPTYGLFDFDGRLQGAHRVSWQIVNGPIPDGLFVLHRCDNAPCVRPDHLFIGTQSDNILDCSRKGRLKKTSGEIAWNHKLTE